MGLTAQQLELRRGGIGSSDIAAVLGEDPFKGPLDVFLDKTGRSEDTTSEQAELGQELEPVIADRFARKNGFKLRKCGTRVHSELPWVMATADRRIVKTRDLAEVKNVGWRMAQRWSVTRDVIEAPAYVLLQGHWQCLVLGMDAFWIVALIGGRDFYQQRFEFDAGFASDMLEVADKFWREHVLAGVQPAPGATEAARKLLEKLHPRGGAGRLEATPEIGELAKEYARAQAVEAEWKRTKTAAGNRLRQLLGEHDETVGEWGSVTWRAGKGKTAWAKVAKELGADEALIAKHTGKPGRTLNVRVDGYVDQEEDE